ncbi:site-specific integrase [Nocardioides guangzhouensis]|uniref:Site-specific integrase n=1 Tax=Nocardioides guangzhouensis TaxID=2497878 RepID=A0A4Q4ZKU8_9ACTN|nr:tyrosine-type recombinase/integrase [Nocardioides guangzhouensis]RYP88678.1 site-specific integrase [Nocardioides guangzhouensis]
MSAQRRNRPRGAGTAYKRADGRWAAQIFVTESGTNRRVRKTIYAKTRKELEEKRTELISAEARREPIPPSKLTVAAYLEEWLEHLAKPRVRPTTFVAYRNYVEKYLVPGLGSKPVGRLSAREVRLYLDDLRRSGTGARTIQYLHATLRAALEDAVREELIPKNVAKLVRVARPERTERQPLSVEDVRTLLTKHDGHEIQPMLAVFALLGMRRSEVLGLKWEDVDLAAGSLKVRRGLQRVNGQLVDMQTKTERSRRTVPLPAYVLELLRLQADQQAKWRVEAEGAFTETDYVFTTHVGTPIDPRNCTRVVQNACKRAGVRVVRLHDFRHGCVSVLLDLGVPPRTAMEIVGHTTIEMTMNVYGHVSIDSMRSAMDQLGDLFQGRGECK